MNAKRRIVRTDIDRRRAIADLGALPLLADGYEVTIRVREAHVSVPQIRKVMALCGELAEQLRFPGGGFATAEHWYKFMTGLHRGEAMVREGLVVVVLGGGLSELTRREASELIEFIHAWGAEKGVRFGRSQ